ncbi:hypothetical protein M758_4G192200 [Ceratodon purpureus]|nr:hypothetical protein M758_4G192200 [Ceratodon purpureus]
MLRVARNITSPLCLHCPDPKLRYVKKANGVLQFHTFLHPISSHLSRSLIAHIYI